MSGRGNWLASAWRTRGLVACLLWPLSVLYSVVSSLHRMLYLAGFLRADRCATPLVVVGNVIAGGAGKTPLVIALARHLQQRGLQVGIVSRGYGRQSRACLEVLASTPVSASGDEPALMFQALAAPVFVATRRINAVRALLGNYPSTQVIISDDGLQHHGLVRDIDITVFDDRGVGNGWLLPAGPLRERWPGQRKNSLVLHTGQAPAFDGFVSSRRLADYAVAADGRQVLLGALQNQPLTALAGIANPDAFFEMLKARGLSLKKTIYLPDHFDFSQFDLSGHPDETLLCTEKDAVKLFKLSHRHAAHLLAVPLEFSPESAFLRAFDEVLEPLLRQRF